MEDPYVYTEMIFKYGESRVVFSLPQSDNNLVPITMIDELVNHLFESQTRFRMTKNKVFWWENGVDCLIELS